MICLTFFASSLSISFFTIGNSPEKLVSSGTLNCTGGAGWEKLYFISFYNLKERLIRGVFYQAYILFETVLA